MASFAALPGRAIVAALLVGGFRVARRERGLALLVRDGASPETVVVPEHTTLEDAKLRALLARANVTDGELLTWLAKASPVHAARAAEVDMPSSGTRSRPATLPPPSEREGEPVPDGAAAKK